jgi:hypothetical protein
MTSLSHGLNSPFQAKQIASEVHDRPRSSGSNRLASSPEDGETEQNKVGVKPWIVLGGVGIRNVMEAVF